MDAVIRGLVVYFFVLLVFRVSGKRSMQKTTTFDFVLLLIISETTQQAMIGENFSVTYGFILIVTLVATDIALSLWKRGSKRLEKLIEGVPLVVLENRRPLPHRMHKEGIDEEDILSAARTLRGLHRLDQIRYAILERNGGISIVPQADAFQRFPAVTA